MGTRFGLGAIILSASLIIFAGCASGAGNASFDKASSTGASTSYPAACDAETFLGQSVSVMGTAKSARYAPELKGQPTYIYFGDDDPNQCLSVVIWGKDRGKFSANVEKAVPGETLKVTGKVELSWGKPQITVTDPSQMGIQISN